MPRAGEEAGLAQKGRRAAAPPELDGDAHRRLEVAGPRSIVGPAMTAMIFQLLGGIGLFLMGMVMLTDGLKAAAGQALQQALVRFTGTPVKAFGSGALVTLLVQSSSATTVTLIGFVSAGLIAFPQAVGVVMGASLGTTGTGWIVSVLGLKVSLGFYALPLVGVGALLRLLAHGRWRAVGMALAGFGLIFIGIDTLQDGMRGVAAAFDMARLPTGGLQGHVLAMLIGIGMTVVMQSSSAAVATTLTALHAQAVNFEQAASLVVGAAIGTTVTGALAAIGGSTAARRTALAHVLFNAATGVVAIVLLPLLLALLGLAQRHAGLEPGAVSLAAFHTLFIAIGVAVALPHAGAIARRLEAWLPERGPALTRHLDDSLLQAPPVALEASRRTLVDILDALLDALLPLLQGRPGVDEGRRAELAAALDRAQAFFARVPPLRDDEPLSAVRVAQLHVIDHLSRLLPRLSQPPAALRAQTHGPLRDAAAQAGEVLARARELLAHAPSAEELQALPALAQLLAERKSSERLDLLRRTADGLRSPSETLAALDALRWLERVVNHAWRASHHLAAAAPRTPVSAQTAAAPAPG